MGLELTTWINDADLGQSSLRSDILIETWRVFREQGIDVPYPRHNVHLIEASVNAPHASPE